MRFPKPCSEFNSKIVVFRSNATSIQKVYLKFYFRYEGRSIGLKSSFFMAVPSLLRIDFVILLSWFRLHFKYFCIYCSKCPFLSSHVKYRKILFIPIRSCQILLNPFIFCQKIWILSNPVESCWNALNNVKSCWIQLNPVESFLILQILSYLVLVSPFLFQAGPIQSLSPFLSSNFILPVQPFEISYSSLV